MLSMLSLTFIKIYYNSCFFIFNTPTLIFRVFICAGGKENEGVCNADSGGPLVVPRVSILIFKKGP